MISSQLLSEKLICSFNTTIGGTQCAIHDKKRVDIPVSLSGKQLQSVRSVIVTVNQVIIDSIRRLWIDDIAQHCHDDRQRCQSLLAIDDEMFVHSYGHGLILDRNDRTQKLSCAFIGAIVGHNVIPQSQPFFFLPGVGTLEERYDTLLRTIKILNDSYWISFHVLLPILTNISTASSLRSAVWARARRAKYLVAFLATMTKSLLRPTNPVAREIIERLPLMTGRADFSFDSTFDNEHLIPRRPERFLANFHLVLFPFVVDYVKFPLLNGVFVLAVHGEIGRLRPAPLYVLLSEINELIAFDHKILIHPIDRCLR